MNPFQNGKRHEEKLTKYSISIFFQFFFMNKMSLLFQLNTSWNIRTTKSKQNLHVWIWVTCDGIFISLLYLCLIQKVDSRVEVNAELFTLCLIQKVDSRVEVNAELFTCLIQKVDSRVEVNTELFTTTVH